MSCSPQHLECNEPDKFGKTIDPLARHPIEHIQHDSMNRNRRTKERRPVLHMIDKHSRTKTFKMSNKLQTNVYLHYSFVCDQLSVG